MPSLQQLRYLVALGDTMHFTRAAELMHVTQPTLSMQIRELEARLGVRLVERTRARVLLTPVGAAIVQRARTILAEVEDIRDLARTGDAATRGTLRMGVVQTVGAYLLSVVVPDLRDRFPALRLYVREELPARLLDALSEGTHDILILPEDPARREVETARLMREPLRVVLPHDHPLAARPRIAPEDLAGETVLAMERGHRMHDQISTLCNRVGAIVSRDYEGTSLDTLRQMVATGMGISLLPSLYVRSEVTRENLVVARPFTEGAPMRDIVMAWRGSSPNGPGFRTLAAAIRDSLAAQPDLSE